MRIEKEKAQLLMIDFQEKLFPHMDNQGVLGKKVITLLEGMKALTVPILATRQYPKGLGDTIKELGTYFSEYYDKMTFSCCGSETLLKELQKTGRKNVIVTGIEAHICVLQTVIDLKAMGFTPIVVVDAIGSRNRRDYEIALKRMEYEGVVLTTVESVLFELCQTAGTEEFKMISRLIK